MSSNKYPATNVTRELEWCKKNPPYHYEGTEVIEHLRYYKTGKIRHPNTEIVDHLNIDFLKKLLSLKNDLDPNFLGCYRLEDDCVYKLQPYIQHKIDTKRYDYFIATYTLT